MNNNEPDSNTVLVEFDRDMLAIAVSLPRHLDGADVIAQLMDAKGIDQADMAPGGLQLVASFGALFDTTELVAAVLDAVSGLLGLESVHDLNVKIDRRASNDAEDSLCAALVSRAQHEWSAEGTATMLGYEQDLSRYNSELERYTATQSSAMATRLTAEANLNDAKARLQLKLSALQAVKDDPDSTLDTLAKAGMEAANAKAAVDKSERDLADAERALTELMEQIDDRRTLVTDVTSLIEAGMGIMPTFTLNRTYTPEGARRTITVSLDPRPVDAVEQNQA